jgi:hypothetical protein
MKTLGQIAYEALCDANYIVAKNWYTPSWPEDQLTDEERAKFEYVAQAVRAKVIEECFQELDRMANEDLYGSREWSMAAERIRLLKEKKET